ncbi:MAG: alanine racemase, partial [Candidatus Peribacteraceae bacterium]|nr:alanine racemase [Candidatus Peribacteraceae bacterium]
GEVEKNFRAFRDAFATEKLPLEIFYAMKSNYYGGMLRTVIAEGGGIDASSHRELELALAAGARKIIYTGPAKSEADFELILRHADSIAVNLESRRELKLLSSMAAKKKLAVRCGVRVVTGQQKGWSKFGIALKDLPSFLREARKLPGLDFQGIHFHISLNRTPERYVGTLEELSSTLKELTAEERAGIRYLDMGGGYIPAAFEGVPGWNPNQEMKFVGEDLDPMEVVGKDWNPRYTVPPVSPIGDFAQEISAALRAHIFPLLPHVQMYAEPGRFLCHSSMHMLFTLMDLKDTRMGVTDGGTNMIGWEKYQCYHYVPLFDLTHFSLTREVPFVLYGSLCTPDDVWGYYLHASEIQEGDLILLPYQGAYTYTLSQQFIKDIPPVVDLA